MAYCTKCGTSVGNDDRFCPSCGMPQHMAGAEGGAVPPSPRPLTGASGGIRPNIAAMLCYIPWVGWIAALIFLTLEPYRLNQYTRFHAFQGLYLAAVSFLAHVFWFPFMTAGHGFVFGWFGLRRIIHLLVLAAQIVGIIKTAKACPYRVPLIGDLAEKSMA